MQTFRNFLENKDEEQLRKLGLKPKHFTIGKFPQYDYGIPDEDYPDYWFDADTKHLSPEDYGTGGAEFERDQELQQTWNDKIQTMNFFMLKKLKAFSNEVKDQMMYRVLNEKYAATTISGLDWLVAADWLEDKGLSSQKANILRKFGNKMNRGKVV